jgi:acyl-CoA hydrolase
MRPARAGDRPEMIVNEEGPPPARSPGESCSVLTARMGLRDANPAGDVHGGWIMKLCDDVAVIAATRHARGRVVTLAVDGMLLRDPVRVGEVLTFKATVNAAWRTSMEVGVRVDAEHLHDDCTRHTLTAYFTMVALDESATPCSIPKLLPGTEEESRRMQEANVRRRIRLADSQELEILHTTLIEQVSRHATSTAESQESK